MDVLRDYLGYLDIKYIALHRVFPGSAAILKSPVLAEGQWPVVIEAPEHQTDFLVPIMKRMLKDTPLTDDGEGWIGVNQEDDTHLDIFYTYEDPKRSTITLIEKNVRRIELLLSKFRIDAARYADLMFERVSLLEVVSDISSPVLKKPEILEKQVAELVRKPVVERVELPPGFKNGKVMLTAFWLQ